MFVTAQTGNTVTGPWPNRTFFFHFFGDRSDLQETCKWNSSTQRSIPPKKIKNTSVAMRLNSVLDGFHKCSFFCSLCPPLNIYVPLSISIYQSFTFILKYFKTPESASIAQLHHKIHPLNGQKKKSYL